VPLAATPSSRVAQAQADVLHALQRDLREVIAPELSSDAARSTLMMVDEMLGWIGVTQASGDDLAQLPIPPLEQGALSSPPYDAGSELIGDEAFAQMMAQAAAAISAAPDDRAFARAAIQAEAARLAREDALFATSQAERAPLDTPLSPERLSAWLGNLADFQGGSRVAAVSRVVGGFSKDTWLVDMTDGPDALRKLVLRRDLPFGPGENSVVDEAPLLAALSAQGLPVPRPIAVERTGAVAGTPFILVPRLPGKAVFGDWDAEPTLRAAIAADVAQTMAHCHRIDAQTLGLPTIAQQDAVAAMVSLWRGKWERRRLYPSAILEAAFAWLAANVPPGPQPACLVHGDVSFRNTLIEQGRLTALLDWEFAHLGDPVEDLSYFELVAAPVTDWPAVLQAYEAAGGPPYDPARARFYAVWRSTRNAVTTATAWHGFVRGLYPVSKAAYQGLSLYRFFLRDVAAKLEEVL